MTQEELKEEISRILKENNFLTTEDKLIPGASLFALSGILATKLMTYINYSMDESRVVTPSPVEDKNIANHVSPTVIPPAYVADSSIPNPLKEIPDEKIEDFLNRSTTHDQSGAAASVFGGKVQQEMEDFLNRPATKEESFKQEDLYNSSMPLENVGIKLDNATELPEYATEHASGFDLVANFVNVSNYVTYAAKFNKHQSIDYFIFDSEDHDEEYKIAIMPGCSCPIPTGVYLEIPIGFEVQVRPRSGIATKQGLRLANCEGTIDADYRGEVIVALYNDSKYPQEIKTGMKIAQAVLCPVSKANFIIKQELSDTNRGAGGFNSTGTNAKTK